MVFAQFLQMFLRGLGQIMLQPCALTGALFLVGISVNSLAQAIAASLAALVGQVYGELIAKREEEWKSQGLFGFNAALVGIASAVFFAPGGTMLLLLVAGSVLASVAMHLFLLSGKPAYTAPFVIAAWLVVAVGKGLGLAAPQANEIGLLLGDLPFAPLTGIGQVMFQKQAVSGLCFLIGVALCPVVKRGWRQGAAPALKQTIWTLFGSFCGGVLAWSLGQQLAAVTDGLYGFNAALAALAVSMLHRSNWAPLLAVLLSVLGMMVFQALELPALTAPFVLATWIVHLVPSRPPGIGAKGH